MTISALPPAPQTTDPATFDVRADALLAALPTFINECNATATAMNFNDTNGTSSTSVSISVASKTFTASTGKSWQLGMTLRIASTASPTNFMTGEVTAYNSSTGALTVNVTNTSGSGTLAAWTISQAGVMLQAPVLNLTGYSGADVVLGVGQSATYTLTAATSLLFRIATGDNQEYEISLMPTVSSPVTSAGPSTFQPNNANTGAGAVTATSSYQGNGTPAGGVLATNVYQIDTGLQLTRLIGWVSTKTICKTAIFNFFSKSSTSNASGMTHCQWNDTTTVHSSLGTMNFVNAITGLMRVTRKL